MIDWGIVGIKLTRQFAKISLAHQSEIEMKILRSWRHEGNERKLLQTLHQIPCSAEKIVVDFFCHELSDDNTRNKFSRT